ncbi:MAG: trypsin-like serine protease [Pseudomonadales bacterium]
MIRWILLTASLTGLAAGAAHAVTWGEPDTGEHPHVGTLLFVQNGEGFYSCTGTMISPIVMLTAGHCVAGADENGVIQRNDLTVVRFDDDALAGINDHPNLFEWFSQDWIFAAAVEPHPMYNDYAEFPDNYDIGVVILSSPYVPTDASGNPVFGTLPDLGFLETLRGRDKQDFTAVGYGQQGTLPPFAQNDYEKYKGSIRLLEAKSYLVNKGDSSARFSNNPGIGGGTCYGDSGGPTFYKDTEIVVAVTSFGWAKNGNCVGNDFNFRTDIMPSLNFLQDILNAYPAD